MAAAGDDATSNRLKSPQPPSANVMTSNADAEAARIADRFAGLLALSTRITFSLKIPKLLPGSPQFQFRSPGPCLNRATWLMFRRRIQTFVNHFELSRRKRLDARSAPPFHPAPDANPAICERFWRYSGRFERPYHAS